MAFVSQQHDWSEINTGPLNSNGPKVHLQNRNIELAIIFFHLRIYNSGINLQSDRRFRRAILTPIWSYPCSRRSTRTLCRYHTDSPR